MSCYGYRGLRLVFVRGRYVLLATTTALAVFILATWLPNLSLVRQIVTSGSISFADKVRILTALIGSIGTNFTLFSGLSTAAIAVLFGANVALIAYYIQRQLVRQTGKAGAATSLAGLVSGLFGVGCAACGTFVLGPVASFVGVSGLVAVLPLGGEEFGMLGIAMLCLSLVLTARKIGEPVTCSIEISAMGSGQERKSPTASQHLESEPS